MKIIETVKNIWKIEDLKNRILITVLMIVIYRFLSIVTLPGINPSLLSGLQAQTKGGLMSLLDMFSGGAFSHASIVALGVMPYISASIVIQLLSVAVPYFQKLQREGESGRCKINQYIRYLTLIVLLLQAPTYLVNLNIQMKNVGSVMPSGVWFTFSSVIVLSAGSMFVLWLGERITDKGIGNGISFIIMVGIIARLPQSLIQEIVSRLSETSGGLVMFLVEIIILLVVIAGSIMLVQGTRKISIQYAKRMIGNRQYGGVRQYIPLKVNVANVMPIIFAQTIMFIPISLINFGSKSNLASWLVKMVSHLTNINGFWYNFVDVLLIVIFTWFYTAITINPKQMAEDLKRNNVFVPGIKPGKKTMEHIDSIMSKLTFSGSFFLALVAIMPAFAKKLGIQQGFASFFGGTSLLILIGVVLDTLQQVESYLLNHHYDGLLKLGRIKGKS